MTQIKIPSLNAVGTFVYIVLIGPVHADLPIPIVKFHNVLYWTIFK